MAAVIRLDTHVVVWLYAGDVQRLSPDAREMIERDDLAISPLVELELTFLHEIGRVAVPAAQIVADLRDRIGLAGSPVPLPAVVAAAAPLDWARDPFDRLIVGDSLAAGVPLVTKDASIRAHLGSACW
jgi:PIN domain nuclease of toxin-antitoxin system